MIVRILSSPLASRILLLSLLAVFLCSPAEAKRKDVVVMNNGDHFTGEVKRLQNGLLFVETDYVSRQYRAGLESGGVGPEHRYLQDCVEQR